ncbi:MAG: hypothetical protein N4A70_19945 [Pelagimonas sp.]|jgi:hypothetical protein|nr:hypothetical protein [Pelagimonas sp.]
MLFLLALALCFAFIGSALLFLTRKSTYQRLHEHGLRTNPIYRWQFEKSQSVQMRVVNFNRRFLRGVASISVSIGVLLFCGYLVRVADPFRGDKFDPQTWAEAGLCKGLNDGECAQKERTCPRGGMVHDLISNHLISQTTRSETVIKLLGQSTYDIQINGLKCPGYSLGMCSGLGLDYDSLFVCFDQNGTVAFAGHVQH